jgi:hypothetical protein
MTAHRQADWWVTPELSFTANLQQAATMMAPMLPPAVGAPLQAAWARVQRSGVLQQRNIGAGLAIRSSGGESVRAAAANAAAQRGLHTCALASCGAKEGHAGQFKLCSACKSVVYCCKAHQADDWAAHKQACKAARKAAPAAAAQ